MTFRDYAFRHPLMLLQLSGWGLYIIVDLLGHMNIGYVHYGESFAYGLAACALTSLVAWISHKLNDVRPVIRVTMFFGLLYIAALIWHQIYHLVHQKPVYSLEAWLTQIGEQPWLEILQIGTMPSLLFLAWGGSYWGAKWYLENKAQHRALTQALLESKRAQIETMRYQLNPHFLFNVLNSVDVTVLKGEQATAHKMIQHLSEFLRRTLQFGDNDKIQLAQELEMVNSFIIIEQMRFGDAIEVKMDIDDTCREALIPPMLLQPLVENAIKYGWLQKEKGQIQIMVKREANDLQLAISNKKQSSTIQAGTGVGLENTKTRLALLYGSDASLRVLNENNQFDVQIRLPWEVLV